jgi:non-specific serine/threonine protein kinase
MEISEIELSPLQWKALDHITSAFSKDINPLCALGMGAGKTRIACKVISDIKQSGSAYSILIADKASLFNSPWIDEMTEWRIIDEYTHLNCLYGKKRDQYLSEDGTYSFPDNIILLTTYDTLVRDIENNRFDLNKPFSLIVIDEIQLFMNSNRLTKRCKTIAKISSFRKIALSGTPIQNNSFELGLLYLFLNNPSDFSCGRNISDDTLKAAMNDCLTNNAVFYELGEKKGSFKKDEAVLCLPINPKLLAFAETIKSPKRRLMFLSNPSAIYYHYGDKPELPNCAKIEAVKTILTVHHSQKCILFSQFIDVLYAYEDIITNMGETPLVITGNDKGDRLQEKITVFEHSRRCNILLTTLQKSSEGLNLSFANHIIILEFWWNPHKIFQAMNRIDRKGQERDVFIYLLCYHNGRECINDEGIIYEAMERKTKEANAVLQKYTPVKSSEQSRELPKFVLFDNIDTLNNDLKEYLNKKTYHHYDNFDDSVDDNKGKPLTETIEKIKDHPLMKERFMEVFMRNKEKHI